ncbi:MAG: cytochrome c [Pseudomonadota bacterium]|nr:cytochrome c [Pseudomonadota bacterium]
MYGHAAWLPMALLGLAGCSAPASTAPRPGAAGDAPAQTGARLYDANCTACHQSDARGVPGVYPSLVGSPVILGDPRQLARWVVEGRRPPSLPPGRYPTAMLQFGWMKPADAAALFTYLRSNFGNAAPPVEPAVVAQALGEEP